ncbi:hypothetical protein BDP27DRAFT_1426461 [Rhodocollybia butyracea]|uniref:Uncharacterized protein n=1 Tax=Rhodocollybia butyracea TaxID=206335 RepID=A0A9P5PJK9_9AGAR|nr:hypothetical protein BDP27DRAFT_1426461 [Rhodocollybia butyracea]
MSMLLLTSPCIIKVDYSIERSVSAISATFSTLELMAALHQSSSSFLDLGKLAKVKGVVTDPCANPSSIVAGVLKKQYPLITNIALETSLSDENTTMLATEVECAWQTYTSLSHQDSVGLQLWASEAKTGQLVTLTLAHKEIAQGTVLEHTVGIWTGIFASASVYKPELTHMDWSRNVSILH